MRVKIIIQSIVLIFGLNFLQGQTIPIEELDFSTIEQGWEVPKKGKNVSNQPMTMNGKVYYQGLGTHATSIFKIRLFKKAVSFSAICGLDDMVAKLGGHSVVFELIGDKKTLWKSDTIKPGSPPVQAIANLKGVQVMTMKVTGFPGSWHTHANWANAIISYEGTTPETWKPDTVQTAFVFPVASPVPAIHGPSVFGVRPGSPFLYKIPASGNKPIIYSADNLPHGLNVDTKTGIITGSISIPGDMKIVLKAANQLGSASKNLVIKVGNEIGLTPPLGWNSWNAWGVQVDREKVIATAKAFIDQGLSDYGWSYVNIDDGWQGKRDGRGILQPNEKFGDIKSMVDSIHDMGLRFGIYSSPGPLTCWRMPGSYRFEDIDANTFAGWGVDYLKYDWCSYQNLVSMPISLEDAKKPYALMGSLLSRHKRDIYYSLCQYGTQDVWKWGKSIHANSWRTTEDIYDSWASMSHIGFSQERLSAFAEPGHINDPDMLVVGVVGWGTARKSRLTPAEQMSHMSLWALLSAPMLLGCDLTKLDDFTKNLLTNEEVLAIQQDALVKPAVRVYQKEGLEIWTKSLEDGGTAVGLFNTDETEAVMYQLPWELLKLPKEKIVRDVWQQKNVGKTGKILKGQLPYHSSVLFKIMP